MHQYDKTELEHLRDSLVVWFGQHGYDANAPAVIEKAATLAQVSQALSLFDIRRELQEIRDRLDQRQLT